MNRRPQIALLSAASAAGLLTWLALAAEAGEAPKLKPELKPDPKVMAELNALGENSSLLLPPVHTAGEMSEAVRKFGLDKTGPRTRNYCVKWVWAPDRKRALFCGANAGVPHRLNDVWEYDLPSNTWALLWEPDPDLNQYEQRYRQGDPEAVKVVESVAEVKDGVLMTRRGAPFDPVHTWWALTYAPGTRALLWVMGNQNKVGYRYKSSVPWGKIELWAYYPYEHRWEFIRPDAQSPPGQNASILEYLPDRKQVLWYTHSWRGDTTSLWNPEKRTWRELLGKQEMSNPGCPGTEAIAAYDTKNQVLVAYRGGEQHEGKLMPKRTYHYDLRANKWELAIESEEGPIGTDAWTSMTYDSVAGCCYIVDKYLWSYRIGDKRWEKVDPKGAPLPCKINQSAMSCYNPDLNVLMVDFGGGQVWVYRGRKP